MEQESDHQLGIQRRGAVVDEPQGRRSVRSDGERQGLNWELLPAEISSFPCESGGQLL